MPLKHKAHEKRQTIDVEWAAEIPHLRKSACGSCLFFSSGVCAMSKIYIGGIDARSSEREIEVCFSSVIERPLWFEILNIASNLAFFFFLSVSGWAVYRSFASSICFMFPDSGLFIELRFHWVCFCCFSFFVVFLSWSISRSNLLLLWENNIQCLWLFILMIPFLLFSGWVSSFRSHP